MQPTEPQPTHEGCGQHESEERKTTAKTSQRNNGLIMKEQMQKKKGELTSKAKD